MGCVRFAVNTIVLVIPFRRQKKKVLSRVTARHNIAYRAQLGNRFSLRFALGRRRPRKPQAILIADIQSPASQPAIGSVSKKNAALNSQGPSRGRTSPAPPQHVPTRCFQILLVVGCQLTANTGPIHQARPGSFEQVLPTPKQLEDQCLRPALFGRLGAPATRNWPVLSVFLSINPSPAKTCPRWPAAGVSRHDPSASRSLHGSISVVKLGQHVHVKLVRRTF